ncbi:MULTISPECIES: RodZ domain-containing protein [Pseudomonas]|uniref:Cro/Cl family transcriptional regulator n=1 Tax=Pseudomonas frederiksbergensis TaxID=104087 RepID=A0A0B1YYQ8_9PSED|nr:MULTISPECIES: RodZ family helix-turn-helix domain-containing protein [Pseudomonas]KHK64004.1 Cro/Cl family transcriptional regulator [Pseudomonas frederiksbergensis]KJH87612.1 Cro/Cl family transcriptional regulator [Pseudomonas fluorescens]MBI6619985.1 helix-turn-helix domain-containing protein [Pseudomonas corrugata]MBI6693939.1 helix-turn-helix domain-containing protein [Pseudomonas corrugata]WRV67448.1 RodZ family helix-turn-helix domain-containing protein [Pseudomonas frederiksbergensi
MKAAHPEVVAATRVNPGETLRQARESNGWSLAEVALKLNLTVTSLSNLEAGAFDKLPGHTFARGYIRAYAKLLGMDQTVLVQQFDQYTGSDAQGSNVHSLGRIEEPVRVSHTILRIVSLLLLIAVIGGGFVWWQDQASLRGKEPVVMNPEHVEVEGADGTTQIHPLDEPEDQAVVQGQAEGETALALPQGPDNGEADAAAGSEPVVPAVPAPAPAAPTAPAHAGSTPVAPAAPASPAPATPAPTVAAPTVPAAPAVPTAPAPAPGDGQVQIQFTADCWTQITDGNGKVLFSGLKRKGDTTSVNGKPPFAVRLGYARGAQVSYNGQPVDIAPFTSGETARLKLGQ